MSCNINDLRHQVWNQAAAEVKENFQGTMEELLKAHHRHSDFQDSLEDDLIKKIAHSSPDQMSSLLERYQHVSQLSSQAMLLETQILKETGKLHKIAFENHLKILKYLDAIREIPNQSDRNLQIAYHEASISKMTSHLSDPACISLESKLAKWTTIMTHDFEIAPKSFSNEKIRSIIDEFKEKALQSLVDFRDYLFAIQKDDGTSSDKIKISNGIFIAKLVEQVAKRYFETSRQLIQFESLQNGNVLEKYGRILSQFYSIKLQSLELMHKEIKLLQIQTNHEKKLVTAILNQKLKEQDMEISRILNMEILEEENLVEMLQI